MNQSDYMTNPEKLIAFLDGELHPSEAESMFFDVATNSALQEEMRRQILISKTLKNSLIPPPPALKESIMANIAAGSAAATATQTTVFSKMLNSRVFMVLSALIFATLATYMLMSNYTISDENTIVGGNMSAMAISKVAPEENNFPFVSSESVNEFVATDAVTAVSRRNAVPAAFKNNNIAPIETIAEKSIIITEENENLSNIMDKELSQIWQSTTINQPNAIILIPKNRLRKDFPVGSQMSDLLDRVSLHLRFSEAASLTDIDIKPINDPLLNNFAFALMFDVNKNHSIGVEIGQENFLQKFDGYEGDIPLSWHQNYIAFWAGMAYQYSMNDYSTIQPYVRSFVGGTRVGPIAKITIGGKYNLTSKLSAFVGWENTALFYDFQNQWFSSYKSGLTGGFIVKF